MEKYTKSKSTKRYIGLLVLLFISINSLFALTWSSLRVKPETEYCFAGESCLFTLEIPGYLPTRINLLVQSTPENVTVESTSKEEYVKNGVRGTLIKLNFRFSKSGKYTIPSLALRVDWWSTSVKFNPITVYDNPILMEPVLSSDLPKNLEVGKPTAFTVYGKFFNELTNINFELDTKVILTKNRDIEPLPYHIGTFSTETYPIAEFTVIPLEEGSFSLPPIYGVFRNYAGNTVSIALENQKIKSVKQITQGTEETSEQQLFEKEFNASFPDAYKENIVTSVLTPVDESHVILKSLKSEVNQKRIFIILTIVLAVFFLICLTLFMVFAFLKRKNLMITFLSLALTFLIATISLSVLANKKEAISLGCSVKTVPEQNSNTVMQLSAGDKIHILDAISNWYSIESEDGRRGWIYQDQCILVNKAELENFENAR